MVNQLLHLYIVVMLAIVLHGIISYDNRKGRIGCVHNSLTNVVVYVYKDSPAHKAGIKRGDILLLKESDACIGRAGEDVVIYVKRGEERLQFIMTRVAFEECSSEIVKD